RNHLGVKPAESLALVETISAFVREDEPHVYEDGALLARDPHRLLDQRVSHTPAALLRQHRERLDLESPLAQIPGGGAGSGADHGVADRAPPRAARAATRTPRPTASARTRRGGAPSCRRTP